MIYCQIKSASQFDFQLETWHEHSTGNRLERRKEITAAAELKLNVLIFNCLNLKFYKGSSNSSSM